MENPTFARAGHHQHDEQPHDTTTASSNADTHMPPLHHLARRFLCTKEMGIPRTFENDIGDMIGVFLIIVLLFICIAGLRRLLARQTSIARDRGDPLMRARDMEQGDSMRMHRGALWAASG